MDEGLAGVMGLDVGVTEQGSGGDGFVVNTESR
jgi:hypothetical protein